MIGIRRIVAPSLSRLSSCSKPFLSSSKSSCPRSFSSLVIEAVVSEVAVTPAVVDLVHLAEVLKPSYSAVKHPYSINGLPLSPAPAQPADLFAVVELSGTQHKVTLNDVIVADKMEGIDIGQILDLSKVLLVGSRKATVIGRPYVDGAQVIVAVEEMSKDKKVVTLKTRRRKNSRTIRGYRRDVTVLRVVDIIFGEQLSQENLPAIF